ncbi:unnamed protein product [Pleuronectes platessa]|uniref:Uncharacterized protein n=1 Tax=Pleuronectes platessa TaxID=8262 RepID=A0A9N7Z457_PLEPL|nr:unnamed protein product [Pleuronectes platessa]
MSLDRIIFRDQSSLWLSPSEWAGSERRGTHVLLVSLDDPAHQAHHQLLPISALAEHGLPRHPAHLILLPADELPEPSATPSSCSPASPFLLKNSRSHQHSLVLPSCLFPALKNSRSHQHPVYPPLSHVK